MKFFLEKAIFINKAPFENLELDFKENEIAVLSAVNGSGKTTILSHLADAFHEIAKNFFQDFDSNKYYRISSPVFSLNMDEVSIVYFRFNFNNEKIDYIDIRGECNKEKYDDLIKIEDKINFDIFNPRLNEVGNLKQFSSNLDSKIAKKIFEKNVITYFPSYRYETPGYINDTYKMELNFRKDSGYQGYLSNPIEVVSGLQKLANWIMDVVLDLRSDNINGVDNENSKIFNNLNKIISGTVSSKFNDVRFGIGDRWLGGTRIQIVKNNTNQQIYPSIFNLSSGESSILCIFGEILRQADKLSSNIELNDINGIILIDEVDKHLHIKLQKDILPILFEMFPNVQFIVSSHSPFLSVGLDEKIQDRYGNIDLDLGIRIATESHKLYKEVYEVMIRENERFKDAYSKLEEKIKEDTKPLIITEGRTDISHIKKAKERLNINDCDIVFFENTEKSFGDSKLNDLLEKISKIKNSRKIIGIFDRDVEKVILEIEKDGNIFKSYGNNVYAFCIPVPKNRETYKNISIEFYYTDGDLKKEKDGKSLYFDNEVEFKQSASDKAKRKLIPLEEKNIEEEYSKKIFDENVGDLDWIHSKGRFADLIEKDEIFNSDIDFKEFIEIFKIIKKIIEI